MYITNCNETIDKKSVPYKVFDKNSQVHALGVVPCCKGICTKIWVYC